MTDQNTEAEVVRDLTRTAATPWPIKPGANLAFIVPEGASLELENAEHLLDAPRRKRGRVTLDNYDAFVAYANSHADQQTTFWVGRETQTVACVLNDHHATTPGWGDHRATWTLAPTPEWGHWARRDGDLIGQEAFAEHVEDGLAQIVEPNAADMLEIAQSIQATTTAQFRSARRLDSGAVGMLYDETIDAKAGRTGELAIPAEFTLALAPFYGEQPYRIQARLRYRIKAGELRIGYRLVDLQKIVNDCLASIAERLVQTYGTSRVFMGAPITGAR